MQMYHQRETFSRIRVLIFDGLLIAVSTLLLRVKLLLDINQIIIPLCADTTDARSRALLRCQTKPLLPPNAIGHNISAIKKARKRTLGTLTFLNAPTASPVLLDQNWQLPKKSSKTKSVATLTQYQFDKLPEKTSRLRIQLVIMKVGSLI